MTKVKILATARPTDEGTIQLELQNPSTETPISFFNRISVIERNTKKRVLPVFYSDNYVSLLPGETQTITIEGASTSNKDALNIKIEGWNTEPMEIAIE